MWALLNIMFLRFCRSHAYQISFLVFFFLPFFLFLFFDFLISNDANCSWFLPFFLTVCCVICFYCCSHLQHLVKYCLQDISISILLLDTRYLHMLHRNVFFKNLFDCYFWQHYWEAFNLKLWTYESEWRWKVLVDHILTGYLRNLCPHSIKS